MAFGGDNAESYYDEGLTASMKGDLEAAVAQFEKAIRLDRTMASAYHQLGKCYLRMGRPEPAVELLHQVVTKRPENTTARTDYGYALVAAGRIKEGHNQFSQVLALKPGDPKALLGIANAYFQEGDWLSAMNQAQNALVSAGSNFAVQYMLGRAAKLAGNQPLAESSLKKADTILEKSLEIDPEKTESLYFRGEVQFILENFAAALDNYNAAAKGAKPGRVYSAYGENFTMADVLAKKGLCLQRLGQPDGARQMGKEIEAIDPNHKLGKVLRETP